MMTILILILSMGLGSRGILFLIKRSESPRFNFCRKLSGVNTFFSWLILSNLLFYVYFLLSSLLYNFIVVKSDTSESVDGSAGGYFTTEDIATNYLVLSSLLTWLVIIINLLLFATRFYLKSNPTLESTIEKTNGFFTLLLIFLSIIMCFISLLFLVLLSEFSVSYGG
jgi:hypothetical protein